MRIFVTGGAGFIGRNLVASLLDDGHQVTIYENFSNSSKKNIHKILENGVKIVQGDLTDYTVLQKHLRGFDLVVHLAAKIGISESIKNPEKTHEINVKGTINVLRACVKNKISNIVAASSAAVYGNPSILPVTEETTPNPVSPYGADKLAMEFYVRAFANAFDMNSVSLRFFNVYGQGQSNVYAGVITKFKERIEKNQPLVIFGDGSNTRDYVYIKDLVNGIKNAVLKIDGKKGVVYNIASGKSISVNTLAKTMLLITGKRLSVLHKKPREGDLLFSQASIRRAKNELNYKPQYDIKKGLSEMLQCD